MNNKISIMCQYNMSAIPCNINNKEDIYIWMGLPNEDSKQHRIKVVNKLNNCDPKTSVFTILIPQMMVIGNINKDIFNNDIINDIISYINLNMNTILDFSNDKTDLSQLLDNLKPYNR